MAKRIGKCVNIDCDNYKQEVEIEPGEEFECPLCHQHLEEAGGGKGSGHKGGGDNKKKIIIGAVIAVVVIIAVVLALLLTGGKTKSNKSDKDTVDTTQVLPVDTVKADTATAEPQVAEDDKAAEPKAASDNEAKPKTSGDRPIPAKVNQPATQTSGAINLGYGKYKGETKNGKPHGHGVITYTQSHKITASKDFVAQPGDKFEGEFRDGQPSGGIGYWYHDGDITAVKL